MYGLGVGIITASEISSVLRTGGDGVIPQGISVSIFHKY